MKVYNSILLLLCFSCIQTGTNDYDAPSDSEKNESVQALTSSREAQDTGAQDSSPMVYITRDGNKYHTADCRYSKTALSVTLSQAKADGKTACGICNPNSKTGEKQNRCSANTTDGKRCKRLTSDATGKCFQHRDT